MLEIAMRSGRIDDDLTDLLKAAFQPLPVADKYSSIWRARHFVSVARTQADPISTNIVAIPVHEWQRNIQIKY